jgi:two-component system response regulator
MKKKTPYIVLADDDPDDRDAFVEEFGRQNAEAVIKTVTDGKELFDLLNTLPAGELPALILIDYKMPLITGPEVLQHLNSQPTYASIPKLVWSSSTRTKDAEDCRRLGADGFFKKPAAAREMNELVQEINKIFAARLSLPNSG